MKTRSKGNHRAPHNYSKISGLAFLLALTIVGPLKDTLASEIRLSVSPSVAVALEKFEATGLPGFFAVSEDGNTFGFAHCRTGDACGAEVESLAIRFCEDETDGICHILTHKLDTLWPGPVAMPSPEDIKLVKSGWRSFPTHLHWPRDAPATPAWLLVQEGKPIGWLKISRPSEFGPCYGTVAAANASVGSWQLTCGPEETASGTYRREADRWVSEGQSADGEPVRFVTYFE